jgi:hypothetical protein
MLPKNCGQLLFNAVRETLETMAFAEVILCSIKVGNEEFAQDDDFAVGPGVTAETAANEGGWNDAPSNPAESWGTAVLVTTTDDRWGTVSAEPVAAEDHWETVAAEPAATDDGWGEPAPLPPSDDDDGESWGKSGVIAPASADPWNDARSVEGVAMKPKEADFDNMVANLSDWCWACMKVNSPDVHSVWFIVSKSLANALAKNMYAGEEFQLDNPLIRDLIAELTNVLGGRLMLLLEELGG